MLANDLKKFLYTLYKRLKERTNQYKTKNRCRRRNGIQKFYSIFKLFHISLVFFSYQLLHHNVFKKFYCPAGACLDIFQNGFTNFFVLNLPLKYAYLRYALPVKYALCVLRNIYQKKSVFKMLFTA